MSFSHYFIGGNNVNLVAPYGEDSTKQFVGTATYIYMSFFLRQVVLEIAKIVPEAHQIFVKNYTRVKIHTQHF